MISTLAGRRPGSWFAMAFGVTLALGCASADPLPPSTDAGLSSARPEAVGMSSPALGRIGPAMQAYVDAGEVGGTVTLIARRGRLVHFEARGFMDANGGRAMRHDALFRLASLTKPIVSVALMVLWEEGRFGLDDPVSDYLPEFSDMRVSTTGDASGMTGELVDPRSPMTIRHLLTHTAGLANGYRGSSEYYRLYMAGADFLELDGYVERLSTLPLVYHPGEDWQYSTATTVVGRLAEVLSGLPLDRFLEERLFEPLDMRDTRFFLERRHADRLPDQLAPAGGGRLVVGDPGTTRSRWIDGPRALLNGSGGLVSTARDLARFQQALLNGGELDGVRVLAPETVALVLRNHVGELTPWATGPGYGFGLGYAVLRDREEAEVPMSNGSAFWAGAFGTYSWIDPEEELVGVFLMQLTPNGHLGIVTEFRELAYAALLENR